MSRFNLFMKVLLTSGFTACLSAGLTGCSSKSSSSDYSPEKAASTAPAEKQLEELRGVWITNVDSDVLMSKQSIVEMMDYLAAQNFNVVYPVVWNKAQTLYPSDVMEKEFGVRIDPVYGERDPLAELIVEAHRHGIEVVPWFEFGFASSYNIGGGPILEARPEWKAIDQDGNLVKKNDFEWMNAFDPEVQDFMKSLVLEVVENYDIDGVQGDDRLPALPSMAGYDEYTLGLYRAEFGEDPPTKLNENGQVIFDDKAEQWVQFRADILTEFFKELREEVKAINPNVVISSSPSYYDWSLYEYLQDSYAWTNQGIVDSIHPQAYRYDVPAYKKIVDDLVANQFTPEQLEILSPGILIKSGSYLAEPEYVEQAIAYNRANGINGEVFFFYTGLRLENNKLGDLIGDKFYTEPAALYYREGETWRPKGIETPFPATAGWTGNPEFPGLYRKTAGDAEIISYDITVPVAATYRVFTKSVAGPMQSSAITYSLSNGEQTVIDQRDRASDGWLSIGSMKLKAGTNQGAVKVNTGNMSDSSRVILGPVMVLIDRKESPNVDWPE